MKGKSEQTLVLFLVLMPSIINHKTSTINHQSSIINHQSSIINHQSSIINHHPSIINHPSSTINQGKVDHRLFIDSLIIQSFIPSHSLYIRGCFGTVSKRLWGRDLLLSVLPYQIDRGHQQIADRDFVGLFFEFLFLLLELAVCNNQFAFVLLHVFQQIFIIVCQCQRFSAIKDGDFKKERRGRERKLLITRLVLISS